MRFLLVSRRRLEEAERELRYAVTDRDWYKRQYEHEAIEHDQSRLFWRTQYLDSSAYNVRLRRELHALRNHVPLFGDVFDGSILR